MIRLVAMFLVLACSVPALAQQALLNDNKPGPHAVGLRTVAQHDASRSYKPAGKPDRAAGARPIQTVIWYPATGGGTPMRYDDYVQLVGWEDDFGRSPAEQASVVADWLKAVGGPGHERRHAAERADRMWALRDARPAGGAFPVVIYAPSLNSTAFENAEMMEYLASHGYIVVASPALGAASRLQQVDVTHARAQAADIRYLVDFAGSLPHADPARLAVAGFSFGGLANVMAAAQDPRIKALVCLDGSMRYMHAVLAGLPDVDLGKLRTPLLYLAQRPVSHERLVRRQPDLSGSTLHKVTGADVYLLTMQAMEHAHFAASFLRLDPLVFDVYTREEVARAHAAGGRYVRHFLDGVLKGQRDSLAQLTKKPEPLGLPPHSVHSQFIPARP